MKILYILNIANCVNNFSYTSMMAAKSLGWDYYIAGNWGYKTDEERLEDEKKYGINIYQIDFIRQPYHPKNILAYKQLLEVAKREHFDVIHCNTPIGGVVGRLVGKKCGVKRVIYQAHGFHFYKGAPILNWLLYYPVEKWLARYTDALITINQEDYELATRKFKLRNHGKVYYVPGVGIDLEQYQKADIDRDVLRQSLGVPLNAFVLIAVGRLDKNKNNKAIIKAMAKTDAHLILCGDGEERAMLEELVQNLECANRVHFLGNRSDMTELYQTADAFIMASFREGLSRSIMEAMASGLPCIVSKIRGNVDLIEDGSGGFLYGATDVSGFSIGIIKLASDGSLRKRLGTENLNRIQEFSIEAVVRGMKQIYSKTKLETKKHVNHVR